MPQSQRPLFREPALLHYLQKREKDILPRFVSPPIFICAWIMLCLAVAVGFFASTQKVPVQVDGVGVVLAQQPSSTENKGGTVLVFLPASEAKQVRVGESSQIQIGLTGPSYSTVIAQIEPGQLSPSEIYKLYGSICSNVLTITEPSVVVHVGLIPSLSSHLYAGSIVRAQVQVGTLPLLSLPGLNNLIGDYSS